MFAIPLVAEIAAVARGCAVVAAGWSDAGVGAEFDSAAADAAVELSANRVDAASPTSLSHANLEIAGRILWIVWLVWPSCWESRAVGGHDAEDCYYDDFGEAVAAAAGARMLSIVVLARFATSSMC